MTADSTALRNEGEEKDSSGGKATQKAPGYFLETIIPATTSRSPSKETCALATRTLERSGRTERTLNTVALGGLAGLTNPRLKQASIRA